MPHSTPTEKKIPRWLGWGLFFAALVVTFLIGLFTASIVERRAEHQSLFQFDKPIPQWETRSEKWADNFPREYERWLETKSMDFKSKYNGTVFRDALEEQPLLVVLWAGYAFAQEYNQPRGHYYAVKDVRDNLRTGVPQPGTCWTCKSPDVPRMMNTMGIASFYSKPWEALGPDIVNPIGCLDCHNPNTMNLTLTRPALVEAYKRQNQDITQASHQDMRALVCAQCHVEYYFKGPEKYLTFPWDKGRSVEAMEAYYDEIQHVDWVHALSKAPMLKAQHPDFELFNTGIHAKRGLACADCHMPYRREGGVKYTDHKIQSPLNNIANVCQVCHRESEAELRRNVYERQDAIMEIRENTEDLLVKAHIEIKYAREAGATQETLDPILQKIRHAQWRWDFVAASHGASFHSPIESARIMSSAQQKANEARLALVHVLIKLGIAETIVMPDLSTKDKAQAYIGLDMETIQASKQEFLDKNVPIWDQKAADRHEKWDAEYDSAN